MAKSANLTETGLIGPARAAVATVMNGIRSIKFDIANDVVEVVRSNGQICYYDYDNTATVTYSISGAVATVAVSS